MTVEHQIADYIAAQPEPKRRDLETLHRLTFEAAPDCRLWFTDGKNADGKVVTNPNIGYGVTDINHADGTTKEFYRVGFSANTAGISVYILGLDDKTYLAETFGKALGKAKVTGYCIKFRALEDIDLDVLMAAIRHGLEA